MRAETGHRNAREHRLRRVRVDARRAPAVSGGRRRASGSLNRNVRELCRLYAEELARSSRSARLELDADAPADRRRGGERLASRRARAGGARSGRSRRRSSTTTASEASPTGLGPTTAVLSTDGALTTTLVGIVAEREIAADGARGDGVRARHPRGHGIADVSRRRRSATSTRSRGASATARGRTSLNEYLHTPLAADERDVARCADGAARARAAHGEEVLVAAIAWPSYVEGVSNLAHKIVDLTDARALVLLVEMDEPRLRRRAKPHRRPSTLPRLQAPSEAEGTRRRLRRSSAGRLASAQRRRCSMRCRRRAPTPHRARDVMSKPARTSLRPTRWPRR